MNPSGPPGSFCPLEVTSEGSPFLGLVLCSIAKSPCPTSGQFHQHPGLPALCSEQPAGPVSSVQGLLPLDLPCASDSAPELDVQSPSWFGSIHVPSAPRLWSVSPEAFLHSRTDFPEDALLSPAPCPTCPLLPLAGFILWAWDTLPGHLPALQPVGGCLSCLLPQRPLLTHCAAHGVGWRLAGFSVTTTPSHHSELSAPVGACVCVSSTEVSLASVLG